MAYCFLWAFKDVYCVDFTDNISFGRYGVSYLPATMICDSALSQHKNAPMVLDAIKSGIVYEPFCRSDNHLN